MKNVVILFSSFMMIVLMLLGCGEVTAQTVGWAIGTDTTGTPAIVNTKNGGQSWQLQGDLSAWKGQSGCDISAVDEMTAWAALGDGTPGTRGAILYTTDGGDNWVSQQFPDTLIDGIKGIKGLSQSEAWAASLHGTILHTVDSGTTWTVIPHPTAPINQVNRIDAQGTNVWIADSYGDIVHTTDIGQNWRSERLPKGDNPLTVHAYSPQFVWASGAVLELNPAFYRTIDSGSTWNKVIRVGIMDHLDDVCAADPDDAWAVQNGDETNGNIWCVHITEQGQPEAKNVSPPLLFGYMPGGVTCMDAEEAWVVAQKGMPIDVKKPKGIILYKNKDEDWVQQEAPIHVCYWKISFAGARR